MGGSSGVCRFKGSSTVSEITGICLSQSHDGHHLQPTLEAILLIIDVHGTSVSSYKASAENRTLVKDLGHRETNRPLRQKVCACAYVKVAHKLQRYVPCSAVRNHVSPGAGINFTHPENYSNTMTQWSLLDPIIVLSLNSHSAFFLDDPAGTIHNTVLASPVRKTNPRVSWRRRSL